MPKPYFSMDFVSHEQGGRLRWHKTPSAAKCDVSIDPMDFGSGAQRYFLDYYSAAPNVQQIEAVLESVQESLIEELAVVQSLPDLGAVLDRLKAHKARRFGYYNYIQHPISAAFVFARLGNEARARDELKHWMGLDQLISTERSRLDRLSEAALLQGRA